MNVLPDDLQRLVLDFYGCSSIPAHRRFRFVRAELKAIFAFSRPVWDLPRPSFARGVSRIETLKEFLQITYLQAQHKPLLEHQRAIP